MADFTKIEYKGGHPLLTRPCNVDITFFKNEKYILFKEHGIFGTQQFKIPINELINVSFEEKGNRSIGKAAAGAIIGGVLTGGIGLLVGGALGARKKDTSLLYITINYHDRNFDIILKAGRYADNIYARINGMY